MSPKHAYLYKQHFLMLLCCLRGMEVKEKIHTRSVQKSVVSGEKGIMEDQRMQTQLDHQLGS